jgi:hypothetical protein
MISPLPMVFVVFPTAYSAEFQVSSGATIDGMDAPPEKGAVAVAECGDVRIGGP